MKILEEISKLQLDLLDNDWVQGIYYSEFLEFGEFPPDYESVLDSLDIRSSFRHIMKAFNHWLRSESEEDEEEKSWAVLSHKVQHEKLLALLAYYMDYGGKNVITKEHRNNAILASRVYYKLLAIPGYKAYHIYHSQLFAQSLACLSFPKAMCDSEDQYINTKELTHEVNSVIKELQYFVRDLRVIIEPLQLSPKDMNFEDILSNLVDITGGAIVNKLANVDKIELANVSRVIYEIIDILICQAQGEPNPAAILILFKSICPKLVSASMDCKNSNNLVRASYVTYSGLLLTKYGKAALDSYAILLQHLCYTYEGLEKAEVRSARVSLVVGLMSLLPRKSYKKIVDWLLKLSTSAKVAHRHIAMEMLSKLLTNDPEEEKPNVSPKKVSPTKGTSAAAPNNQVTSVPEMQTSEETSEKDEQVPIISTPNVNEEPNSTNNNNISSADSSVTPLETSDAMEVDISAITIQDETQTAENQIIDHPELALPNVNLDDETIINEIDAMLSGNEGLETLALSSNEKTLESNTPIEQTEKDITDASETNNEDSDSYKEKEGADQAQQENINESLAKEKTPKQSEDRNVEITQKKNVENETTSIVATDESSQDSTQVENDEPTEDDIAGLLRQRPHTAPYKAIIHAVVARLNDVSSTLRTKALTTLTACVLSNNRHMQNAIAELEHSGRVAAAAARGAVDERAAVRRAAVPLLAALDAEQPHLQMLVGLCRDASILVRSAAIAAVSDLVTSRPHQDTVDAFLSGPMNQLSDPENKVQEQVTNQVQHILFDRIQKYSSFSAGDPLPWLFLGGIVRKNMRSHLQRACTGLLKSGNCINHRTVDILSTHLSSSSEAHSLQTLVALTCVATHVPYSDVSFVLQYYETLINMQERDGRLMPLTLELLTAWEKWVVLKQRTELRDSLIQNIATAADDGWRVPAVTLASFLDPNNIHWATELMQISERRALNTTDLEEWMRAADLSLVASVPLSNAFIKLLVNSLTNPPPEWDSVDLGRAVAAAGRVSVRLGAAAAALAPALAAVLRAPRGPHARRNALLALADVTTRYTCISEPLLDDMCECLSPTTDPLLRQTASRALTKLLLGGFLRLRANLYYKYVALLADEERDVRGPAEYYVSSCLPADNIYHHFVDCVLYYNSDKCTEKLSFDARQLIYDVMLQRMSLVQKLNTQCRLAREVLQHAADVTDEIRDDEELPAPLNAALLDTITLLCGARMKLPTKKPPRDAEAADIDDLQERVTTNIVSHKMKCTVAEVVVPAVLRLYSRMRARGGQVLAYLVKIATDLLHDYTNEIEELIENDEELVERVRQFQENIGVHPSFGNSRNLVTSSAPPEPETPRAKRTPRRRPAAAHSRSVPSKRALRM